MSRYDTKYIVYSSSATVYGIPKTIPIPETSPIAPESCYGRTKAMCEAILKDLTKGEWRRWRRVFHGSDTHRSRRVASSPSPLSRQEPPRLLSPLLQVSLFAPSMSPELLS